MILLLASAGCVFTCDDSSTSETAQFSVARSQNAAAIDRCAADAAMCTTLCRTHLEATPPDGDWWQLDSCMLVAATADGALLEAMYTVHNEC